MPQYRPRRPAPAASVRAGGPAAAARPVTVGGWHYRVDARAVASFTAAADRSSSEGLAAVRETGPTVSVAEARDLIGRDGVQRAAADAGAPRSASTATRWARQGRIPDARTAELVQRRALVARRGGLEALAAELGVSTAAVSRWQTGQTNTMRGGALAAVQAADALARAGLGTLAGARLQVLAHVEYRAYGSVSPEYRGAREIDIDLDPAEAEALAAALARDDHATATAVVESAWSAWYSHAYSDDAGVHLVDVDSVGVTWY